MNYPIKNFLHKKLIKLNKLNFQIKKYDMQDTIILAGTPRSGTTWLSEVLNTIQRYTIIFEPLHPVWFPEAAQTGFQARTYLSPETTWLEGERYIEKVLCGRIATNRYEGITNIKNNMLSNKLIVKFIRANRLLPWISVNFQVKKIILLIRHPCAVISSQIKSGYYGYNQASTHQDISPEKKKIMKEAQEIEKIAPHLIKKIEQATYREEILAAIWSLDNYIPLNSSSRSSYTVVPYEKLVTQGASTMEYIFSEIGIKFSDKYTKHLTKPSKVASKDLKTVSGHQLAKWKKDLSKDQINRILDMVSAFGLELYNDRLEPDYKKLKKAGHII